jgi:cytochrome d ubiquinol oxidase subunit I
LFGIPSINSQSPELRAAIEIPGLLSYLAFEDVDAYVRGIKEFPPEDWPPLVVPFFSYRLMTLLGLYFIAITAFACYRLLRGRLYDDRRLLKTLVWSAPLPILAIQSGWITAEVGRQPWVVYKLLRTSQAASPAVSAGEVYFSLAVLGSIYIAIFGVWLFLMIGKAKEEPAIGKA